jgi:cystathionine beta-lyase/cystathionine gamma-synthase
MQQQKTQHPPAPDRPRDVTPPIHLSTTYEVSWEEAQRLAAGDDGVPFYARYGNPTIWEVEEQLRALCAPPEAAPDEYSCVVTSSGMAAISSTLLALLQSGDEIIATDTIYGGSAKLMREVLPKWGIETRFTPCDLRSAVQQITQRTKLLWVESPANPTNKLVVFDDAVALAREHNLICCIDATFGPPPLQKPLAHGFDLEVHAATKYLNGHSDVLAGAVVGRHELMQRIRAMRQTLGGSLDAQAAFLLRRGLLTLPLRVRQISATAMHIARYLSSHSAVARVHYLGLEAHPDHMRAKVQMPCGFGGIVAFDLKADEESAVQRFVGRLHQIRHAPSLGGTETLVSYPLLSSHVGQSDEQLRASGITRGTVRLSIGLESVEELEGDVEYALRD